MRAPVSYVNLKVVDYPRKYLANPSQIREFR
nr:MAG TPA: hypothetical protein [Caudoviricetes sp.]